MKKLMILILLLLFSQNAYATDFVDLRFGRYQIADSQWNVSACMYTTTCQIYSTNPGTMYRIPWYNGQWTWQTGQYVQFAETGNTTNPYEGKVYNSNGTYAGTIGTGHVINMGTDTNGRSFFFFVGNDNNTGQLFSTNTGLTGTSGYTWTGTLNPTKTQLNTFASTGSTAPLIAGQTYDGGGGSTAPSYPPATITTSQQSKINQTATLGYNTVYINQYGGNGTSVTIDQYGNFNAVRGPSGTSLVINGSYNTLTVRQGSTGNMATRNLFEASIVGSSNNVTSNQNGNSNYEQVLITGNSNILSLTQSNSNKSMFATVNGTGNNITTSQTGDGNHFLELNIPTDYNTVSVTQSGTAQKMFSLTLNSSNIGVTVVQNNPNTSDSAAMSITCNTGPCSGYSYTKN